MAEDNDTVLIVTPEDVEEVVSVYPNDTVQPFIDMAVALMDQCCKTNKTCSSLPQNLIYHIKLNLACHFYVNWRQQYRSRRTGDASGTYQGDTGMFLESSKYGQTAMLMDASGCLAKLNRQAKNQPLKPFAFWAGKDCLPNETTP